MSFNVDWDVDKYKEDHENDEQWNLRKAFMERWKHDYPEERLICLSRVLTNMEFLGCRYPPEVMHEVAGLSQEIAKSYRMSKKTKLQRAFVSASTMAEDRAKGIKRVRGVIEDKSPAKSAKIEFVPASKERDECVPKEKEGMINSENKSRIAFVPMGKASSTSPVPDDSGKDYQSDKEIPEKESIISKTIDRNYYLGDMMALKCLDVRYFKEPMFHTEYGRMVMLIRPWADKLWNIQASCQACNIPVNILYEDYWCTLKINGKEVARAKDYVKSEAKLAVGKTAWKVLREQMVCLLVKEQWIAHGDSRISVSKVSARTAAEDAFGTPVENNVAMKMMQMMGWKGGGLGADAQGIAEPIRPNLQMVNRAGLGSNSTDERQLRRAAHALMRRYIASDTLDLDLVFSSDFSKEERAVLHVCAKRAGLTSRSYGEKDKDRFLVVRKKLDPFSLVRAVVEKGGVTPKYQVFIPEALNSNN
ncbi:hypothetical protein O3G_MSEX004866 [Manduca sexta]|uniref:NF-kappa-B-repressing factor n=1 Tax=Manduca sexta TaxID=7130 RepID=A0A921YWP4_MANSE|nr:hypothetical protein O3G_MSEX004866 [Manduca sexta]